MNYRDKIKELKNKVTDMREKMLNLQSLYENQSSDIIDGLDIIHDCLPNLMDIRYMHCEIQKDIENQKEIITKEKEKVDEKNLHFQNFVYLKENIQNQILSCVNFPTDELNKITLPKKEDTIKWLLSKGQINTERYEPNKVDFLYFELEQRKNLNEKVNEIQIEKEKNLCKLKEKEKFLKELPNFLTSLETSSLKSQEILDLKITDNVNSNRLLDKLPMPLFTLYYSLVCSNNYDNFDFDLKILGKEEKIDDFYRVINFETMNFSQKFINNLNCDKSKEEGEAESADEECHFSIKNLKKRKKKRVLIGMDSNKSEILDMQKISKFPLFVQLSIRSLKGNLNTGYFNEVEITDPLPITINYYFIPIFNIITCELISKNNEFSTPSLLSNVFLPPINILNVYREEIDGAIKKSCDEFNSNERFYDYLQNMTNNYYFNYQKIKTILEESNQNVNILKDFATEQYEEQSTQVSTDKYLLLLMKRIKYIPILYAQIEYLIKNKKLISELATDFKQEKRFQLVKEKTSILDFIKISQKDFLKTYLENYDSFDDKFKLRIKFHKTSDDTYIKKYIKEPITLYNEEDALYYILVLERNNFKFIAYVEIGLDYPTRPPKFLISLDIQKKVSHIPEALKKYLNNTNYDEIIKRLNIDNFGYTTMLRDIESEVNNMSQEICPIDKIELLFSYQIRHLQMCIDIFCDTENTSKLTSIYTKPFSGKMRKRPFSFNHEKNIFESN